MNIEIIVNNCQKYTQCKTCTKQNSNYNLLKRNIVFLFDFVHSNTSIDLYMKALLDIISPTEYQILYLSKYKYLFDKNLEAAHYNCAEKHLMNELNFVNPKIIFCFGEKSLKFITGKQINPILNKIIYVNNNIYEGLVHYMPSPNVVFSNFDAVVYKYNESLLEARYNIQIIKGILDNEYISKSKIKLNEI